MKRLGEEGSFRRSPRKKDNESPHGGLIPDGEQYKQLMRTLKQKQLLLFTRDIEWMSSSKWEVYFITTLKGENTISPTNLPKMLELSKRHFHAMGQSGERGIVVVECVEYLKEYSDFQTVVKFLSRLIDISKVYGGTVLIPITQEAWSERELRVMKRVIY
nr:DUF835 domain-containing protein [Thermococcus sp. LS1]